MTDLSAILTQPKEDEYLGEGGLLYCARCSTPRQKRLELMDKTYLVRCYCHCQAQSAQREEEARRALELRDRISRYRSIGMTEASLRTATFANDRFGGKEMEVAKRYVEHWEEMRRRALGLVLWGPVGSGKTYIAAAIANALLDRGVPAMMTSFGRILGGMPSAASGEQNRYIASLNAFDLLVIDDLGAERETEYTAEQVYNIIDARYREHLPLIVTTNLKLEDMKQSKSLVKQRIYSRVLERCVPLCVNRRKIREDNASSNLSQAAALLKA